MSLVRAELGLSDGDDDESEPPPALFWYPADYVIATWRQNQKHGTFPHGGAYNDLDPMLEADWQRITARYNWHYDQLRPRDDGSGQRTSKRGADVLDEIFSISGSPMDISDLLSKD